MLMRPEKVSVPLQALARQIASESPRRFVLLKLEVCNSSLRPSDADVPGVSQPKGVSWTGVGTSRELALFVALLGSSLPEESPYRGVDIELELRLCAVEGGPLCCTAARILGDIYHPNIFPNVGLSSFPPTFIPALSQASHRIFWVLDGLYQRLTDPLMPVAESCDSVCEAFLARTVFRSDVIECMESDRALFEARARETCAKESKRRLALSKVIGESRLERTLLASGKSGAEELRQLHAMLVKSAKRLDRADAGIVEGAVGAAGGHVPAFTCVGDVRPVPMIDRVVPSRTAGIRSSDSLIVSAEQRFGFRDAGNSPPPLAWLRMGKIRDEEGNSGVVIEGVRRAGSAVQVWKWDAQDCSSFCLLILSRRDLRVERAARFSPTHPSGMEKMLEALSSTDDQSIICLYTESWGVREAKTMEWMSALGIDYRSVFRRLGCQRWKPQTGGRAHAAAAATSASSGGGVADIDAARDERNSTGRLQGAGTTGSYGLICIPYLSGGSSSDIGDGKQHQYDPSSGMCFTLESTSIDAQGVEAALVYDSIDLMYMLVMKDKVDKLHLSDILLGLGVASGGGAAASPSPPPADDTSGSGCDDTTNSASDASAGAGGAGGGVTQLQAQAQVQAADEFHLEMREFRVQAYLCLHRPQLLVIFAYYALFGGAAGTNNPYRMGSRQWVSFVTDCKISVSFVDSEHLFKESVSRAADVEHWMQLQRLYGSPAGDVPDKADKRAGRGGAATGAHSHQAGGNFATVGHWGSNNLGAVRAAGDGDGLAQGHVPNPKNFEGEMGFDAFLEGIVRTAVKVYRTDDFGLAVRSFLYDKVFPTAQRLQNNEHFDRNFNHPRCQAVLAKNRRNLIRVFMLACPKRWTPFISPARWVDFLKVAGMIGNTLTLARALSFFVLANGGPEAPRHMRLRAFTNGFARCAAERQRLNLAAEDGEALGKAIINAIQHVLAKERELDL